MPAFEVSFSSVDVHIEAKLPAVDRAVLSLVSALGRASIDDIRAYLGLGHDVSFITVRRLVQEQMLDEVDTTTESPPVFSRVLNFFKPTDDTFKGTLAKPVEAPAASTPPRQLRVSRLGTASLEKGTTISIRQLPLRLIAWAQPLWFLGLAGDRQRVQARDGQLDPKELPDPVRRLDHVLAMPAGARQLAFGLGETAPGLPGRLVGPSSNAVFEVRRGRTGTNTLVAASGLNDLPTAFVGNSRSLERCSGLDTKLEGWLPFESVESAVRALDCQCLPPLPELTPAIRVNVGPEHLQELMGDSSEPSETWLAISREDFVRVRAIPSTDDAALAALVLLLARQSVALRSGLETTLESTWSKLTVFWGTPERRQPERERVLKELWDLPATRGALCEARLIRDLVRPYAEVS